MPYISLWSQQPLSDAISKDSPADLRAGILPGEFLLQICKSTVGHEEGVYIFLTSFSFTIISSVLQVPSTSSVFVSSISTQNSRMISGHLGSELVSFSSSSPLFLSNVDTNLVQGFASFTHKKKLSACKLGRRVGILFRKLPSISAALLTPHLLWIKIHAVWKGNFLF